MVFQNRVTRQVNRPTLLVVFKILRTKRNSLIENDMRANNSCLSDDNTRSVVDTEVLSDLRGWMDIYSRAAMRHLGQHARQTRHT